MTNEELIDYTDTLQAHTPAPVQKVSTFKDLLLRDELQRAIRDANLEHPSEIQQVVVPKAVVGADVLCQGKSGTGKTVVFVLSSLQRLKVDERGEGRRSPRILVLSNTKEMAVQITAEYTRFCKHMPVKILSFYGGVDVTVDEQRLKDAAEVDIVVGTCGRILDLCSREMLDLSAVSILILDEVDHLFSTDRHRWTVQRIFYHTPVAKQTMMFTATLSDEVKQTLLLFLKKPFVLEVDKQKNLTLHGLEQGYMVVPEEKKKEQLVNLIDKIADISQAVLFTADKARADDVCEHLEKQGIPSISITSQYSTEERMKRFEAFKAFKYRFLVTTNLMARGIDIAEINLVINYDMAQDANTYLHRVGRAGRFETRGVAVSFICTDRDIVVLNEVQERFDVSVKEIN